jgi:hypothetical protein
MPRCGGIIFCKARMTSRPKRSFSPERVMPGGRVADEEPPPPVVPAIVMSKGRLRSSLSGSLGAGFCAGLAALLRFASALRASAMMASGVLMSGGASCGVSVSSTGTSAFRSFFSAGAGSAAFAVSGSGGAFSGGACCASGAG